MCFRSCVIFGYDFWAVVRAIGRNQLIARPLAVTSDFIGLRCLEDLCRYVRSHVIFGYDFWAVVRAIGSLWHIARPLAVTTDLIGVLHLKTWADSVLRRQSRRFVGAIFLVIGRGRPRGIHQHFFVA